MSVVLSCVESVLIRSTVLGGGCPEQSKEAFCLSTLPADSACRLCLSTLPLRRDSADPSTSTLPGRLRGPFKSQCESSCDCHKRLRIAATLLLALAIARFSVIHARKGKRPCDAGLPLLMST